LQLKPPIRKFSELKLVPEIPLKFDFFGTQLKKRMGLKISPDVGLFSNQ
jgi:hypothetical protein